MRSHVVCPSADPARTSPPGGQLAPPVALEAGPLTALMLAQRKVCFAAKQIIFHEGDVAESVFLFASGTVCLHRFLPNGRRMIKRFLFAGDIVGHAFEGDYPFTAECITPTSAYKISLSDLRPLCDLSATLQKDMIHALKHELSLEREDHLPMLHQAAEARVARLLRILARRKGSSFRNGDPVQLSMTRGDIADYLGLTIETVCRSFTKLKEEGLIYSSSPDRILIRDVNKLLALADGEN